MAQIDSLNTTVAPALRALLTNVVDYAGTFPPASLSLDEAVRNYRGYLGRDEAWMLGRFVCPADRLEELRRHDALLAPNPPFRFSVLAGEGDRADAFLSTFRPHAERVDAFRRDLGDRVRIDSLETRVPRSLLTTDVITIRRFIDDLDAVLGQYDLQPVDLFLELPLDENLRQTLPVLTGAVHAFNRERTTDEHGPAGIKLRTGGTAAEAFPSPQSLAFAISTCRSAGVRFKATAGLHHPIREYRASVDAEMHGFLNVFAAAILASASECDEGQLVTILLDETAASFSFDEDGLTWRDRRAGAEAVERARRDLAVSFGSCSFEEPVEDLRALGLI